MNVPEHCRYSGVLQVLAFDSVVRLLETLRGGGTSHALI